MNRKFRKALSLLLTAAMLCGLLFTTAFAAESEAEAVDEPSSAIAEVSIEDAEVPADAEPATADDGDVTIPASGEITSADQLALMTSGDYYLGADITINAKEWIPVSNFTGTFDGRSGKYSITWSGTATLSASNYAIFATNGGTIENLNVTGTLTLADGGSTSLDYVAAVAGVNNGVINKVTSSTVINAANTYNVGGIAGYNTGYILNSVNSGAVNGYARVGGIVGDNEGTVNSCSNTAQVYMGYNGKGGVGGIAGFNGDKSGANTAHIWNCYNTGYIVSGTPGVSSTQGSWIGGICGFVNVNSDCVNCYNTGHLSGYQYLDHISGRTEGTNYNCYGLDSVKEAQGYDGAKELPADKMTGTNFVTMLSAGASARWIQTSGSYPTLTNTATVDDPNPAKSISFAITQMPEKLDYNVIECFNPAGLVITATRPDGTTGQVPVDTCTFDPSTSTPLTLEDSRVIVSGTFEGSSFSLEIPIVVHIVGIEIVMESKPAKTDYAAGETFDTTGMRIVARTDHGDVDITDYSLSLDGPLTGTDTVETVYGSYDGVNYRFEIDITVSRVEYITLGGSGTFSDFERALDAVLPGGVVDVMGTVTIAASGTQSYFDSVTIKRADGFTGSLLKVTSGTVRLAGSTMILDGGITTTDGSGETVIVPTGTLVEVTGGTLVLRGNVTLTNCETAVDVKAGGAVTVNKAKITASEYSIKLAGATEDAAAGAFTLEDYGGTSISGTVYLGSGAYITVGAAIPDALDVESVVTDIGTVIAKGAGGYELTDTDVEKITVNEGVYIELEDNTIIIA